MNKNCFRLVFSRRLNSLVVVGENVLSAGKAASGARSGSGAKTGAAAVVATMTGGVAYSVGAVVVALAGSVYSGDAYAQAKPVVANALPTGAQITSGSVASSVNGATMTINQASNKAIVNWNTFDVGSAAKVNINQPGSNAVILNRVVGNDPTQIHGQINANGQVMIVNPNGVVVGKDGSVSASGFTASSYGISDADFLAGKHKFDRNGTTAGVRIDGKIEANAGGYVVLIGAEVTNNGNISAPQGTVIMAAGESVTVPAEVAQGANMAGGSDGATQTIGVPLSKRVRLNISAATINTSVNNTIEGVIVTDGGQVLLQAAAVSDAVASVTHSGRIDSSGAQGGAVTIQADQGRVKVDGVIKANSTVSLNGRAVKGGDVIIGRDAVTGVIAKSTDVSNAKIESKGGFVETSGDLLKMDVIQVAASQWLLDPTDVYIDNTVDSGYTDLAGIYTPGNVAASHVKAATLSAALALGTSVTIQTASANGAQGNIYVNEAITSANSGADSTLTLMAARNITINKSITATGSKALNVVLNPNQAGAGGSILISGASIVTNGGNISLGSSAAPAIGSSAVSAEQMMNGITLSGATLNAASAIAGAGGNIAMYGKSFNSYSTAITQMGVQIKNSTVSTSGSGSVVIDGRGMATDPPLQNPPLPSPPSIGVSLETSTISVVNGSLSVKGVGSDFSTNPVQHGIVVSSGSNLSSVNGAISLSGDKGTSGLMGIISSGTIASTSGNVFLKSNGGGITTGTISGMNVAIDNTAGATDAAGIITAGSASSGSSVDAIVVNGALTATNNLSMAAISDNKSGIVIASNLTGKNILASGQTSVVQGPTSGIAGIRWAAGTITSTGTSVLTATGLNTNAQGYGAFDVTGNVTAQATSGTLALVGNATASASGNNINTRGFRNEPGTTLTVVGNVTLEGNSKSNDGFMNLGSLVVNGASSVLTIKGKTDTPGTYSRGTAGVGLGGAVTLNNGSSLNVVGGSDNKTLTSTMYQEFGVSVSAAATITGSGGNISLTGYTSAVSTSSTGGVGPVATVAVQVNGAISSGLTPGAYGKITIEGQNLSDTKSPAVLLNANVNSGTNDLLVQSIGGGVTQSGGQLIGKNVTIDNTGAGLTSLIADATAPTPLAVGTSMGGSVAANGSVVAGTGVSKNDNAINLKGSGILATGNVNLLGNMKSGSNLLTGISTASTAAIRTQMNGGAINLDTNASIVNQGAIETTYMGGEGQTIRVNAAGGTLTGAGSIGSGTNPLSVVQLTNAVSSTYDGPISGRFVDKNGAGVLTTRNRLFAMSQLNVNNGGIQIGDGSNSTAALPMLLDTRIANIAAGASLVFNRGDAYTNNTVMKGSGNLVQAGAGTLTLSGNSSGFMGTTTVNAGRTLAIGTGTDWAGYSSTAGGVIHGNLGAAGSTMNLVSATSSLVFTNTASTSTVGSNINGLGQLGQTGTGTGIVTGTNTYAGPTTISGNTLQVGKNGATGSLGQGNVTMSNNSKLYYLLTANTIMANNITGAGNVETKITGNLTTNNPINVTGAVNLNATGLVTNNGNIQTTNGTSINGGAGVALNASLTNSLAGAVSVHAGNGTATSTAALTANATSIITQSANGGVSLVTDGQGNLTTGSIVNTGTGNVELSAGQKLLAGDGSGGQVKALAGRTISNTNGGSLLIYSGSVANSGDLTPLSSGGLTGAYSSTTFNPAKVAFNVAYGSTIPGGSNSQVLFRAGSPYSVTPTPVPGPSPVPSPAPAPTPTPSLIIEPTPSPATVTLSSTEAALPSRPTVLATSAGTQGSVKLPASGAVGRQFSLASAEGQCDDTVDEEERLRRIRNNEADDQVVVCNALNNNDGIAVGE